MRIKQGSLINVLADNTPATGALPGVGSGATICQYTDRHACSVVAAWRTKTGKLVVRVQRDLAKRTDKNGMSDAQAYSYERNPEGYIREFRQRKDGVLRNRTDCLALGVRNEHFDYSF